MKQLNEVLKLSTAFLQERGVTRARRIAEELIAHCLQIKRLDLYMAFDRPMEEKELAALRPMLLRCREHEPVEYVLGSVEFADCKLVLNRSVLIPRPETEILVEWVKKRLKGWGSLEGKVLWDICTGSGALGIALKKAFPALQVVLTDISKDALALAAQNAQANDVEVELIQGDLLQPLAGRKADVVVCNPPYLSTSEYLSVEPSVKNFEPRGALVGGERGIELYEQLAQTLPQHLNAPALAFFEIGASQGAEVKKILNSPFWSRSSLEKDWAGHDRFFFLEKDSFLE
ncbi:MAG TPA: peptide chain release factor N(5)-glutamine methyltransferase [Chlamydiales bacterium]